jgi:hypothetical protein
LACDGSTYTSKSPTNPLQKWLVGVFLYTLFFFLKINKLYIHSAFFSTLVIKHATRPLQKEKNHETRQEKEKSRNTGTKDDEHPQRKSQSTKECNGLGLFAE